MLLLGVFFTVAAGSSAALEDGGHTLVPSPSGLDGTTSEITNGDPYQSDVSVVDAESGVLESKEPLTRTATVPTAPRNLAASPGDAQAILTWSPSLRDWGKAITGYKVYRGTTSGGEVLLITLSNVRTYTDIGLTNGQTYYYRVSAVNSVGESALSKEASVIPATMPSAPTLNAATPGNAQVSLIWSAPATTGGAPITSYKVYRGTTSNGETLLATLGNVLTYTNIGLTNGQTYYYRVSAVNSIGEGARSNQLSATPSTLPSAPQKLVAVAGDANVALSWSAPASDGGAPIANFKIYRSTSSGGETFLVTIGNVLNYINAGLTNGQTYYYKVSAVSSVGEGPQSNEINAKPLGPPTAPQSLQISPGNAFINITWQPPANNGGNAISNYQVWRSIYSEAETFYADTGLRLWFNDTGLNNGQVYYYKVRAENTFSAGLFTSEASARPSLMVIVPSAPQGLVATAGNARVTLTWSAPYSDGGAPIVNYTIYRGVTSGGEMPLTTIGNVLVFTDVDLTYGEIYYYKVSAVNSAGEGELSNEASAITSTVPTAPRGLKAVAGNTTVRLSWTAPSYSGPGALTYHLFRDGMLVWSGGALGYDDTGVVNLIEYSYSVAAQNSIGWGPNSTEVRATPTTQLLPGIPTNFHVTAGNASVYLSWGPPTSSDFAPITGYKIYKLTNSSVMALLTITSGTSCTDDAVTNGQNYYYQVCACSSVGDGAATEILSAIPQAPDPASPDDNMTSLVLIATAMAFGIVAVVSIVKVASILRASK